MDRRVRKVRLAAANRALVQRGAILLEDAMRTASLPEAPGGRVLVIRSLSLGRIRADMSPSTLSLALEQRVRELERQAVYVQDGSAPTAPAVYFRDPVEPFVMLAVRLARTQTVDAWFWPLAIPGLRLGMPRDEGLRLALAGVLRTEPGPAAAVMLVRELNAQGTLEPLLAALRWQDGPALVRAWWNVQPPQPEAVLLMGAKGPEQALAEPMRRLVARWAETWGAGDARSLWLASVALCTDRPVRVLDPELPARAWRVLGALTAPPQAPSVGTPRAPAPPAPTAPLPVEKGPEPVSSVRLERPGSVSSPPLDLQKHGPAPSHQEPPAPPAEPAPFSEAAEHLPRRRNVSSPPTPEPPRDTKAAPESSPASEPPTRPARVPGEDTGPSTDASFPTTAGGLLFLLPVLEHLGIRELLESSPALIDLAFPERLLIYVATRLGVPANDPLLVALGAREQPPIASACPFVLPARFRAGMAAREPFQVLRDAAQAGRLIAFDARGRVPLAVMRDARAIPPPFDALSAQAHESSVPWDDFTLLLRAFHLAISRVCRARARLGLRGLVLRHGRLVATRTHLDVIFDHKQVDLRIRRAGLDIDPGWVPWLARVIRYHYLYGEFPGN